MPKLNTPNMSAPFWQVSCEATFLQERIWLAVPGPTWRRVRSSSPQHHESDIFQASDKRSGKDYSVKATLVAQQSDDRQGSSKSVQEIRPKQADSKPPATISSWMIFAIHSNRGPKSWARTRRILLTSVDLSCGESGCQFHAQSIMKKPMT